MSEELPFCKCGCGGRVSKKGNKFIIGHNNRSEYPSGKCKICGEIKIFYAKGLCESCYKKGYYEKHYKEHHEEELLRSKQYRESHKEEIRVKSKYYNESKPGYRSSKTNKECSLYLGCTVAEEVLSHIFENVQRMPNGNPGYDFICGKGYKIDAKSSCSQKGKYNPWKFSIDRNTIADYFLCLAFDNREDLNPVHIWMIPPKISNDKHTIGISESTISKWNKYRLDINKVIKYCNTLR